MKSSSERPPAEDILPGLVLVGIPGTNKVMAGELSRLASRFFSDFRPPPPKKEGTGALVYPFDLRLAALAVRYHRTSSRVLWRIARSRASRLEPLYDDLLEALGEALPSVVAEDTTFSVTATNVRSFAAGERQIVGVVKNAAIDGAARHRLRLVVDPDSPALHLRASMHDDTVSVAVDLAGRPMNQRGYRTGGGEAPLRENLAAVLVMLSRHDARSEALVDPMAGSGTIAVEAACMAQGREVWIAPRKPAAGTLPGFEGILKKQAPPLFADTRPIVLANELSGQVHERSKKNAARAGVGEFVHFRRGDFRDIETAGITEKIEKRGGDPGRGVILSNPPYGERIAPEKLLGTYRDLGSWCRRFRGWRAAFLVANRDFEEAFGGVPRIKKPLRNGPLNAYFYMYDL